MGIAKPRLALRDFKLLAAREPGNKDAAAKLAECEKIVRRIQFEKAIESDSPPSAWEGLDPDDLGNPRLDFSEINFKRGGRRV
jgi:serine/threonine-protein phosphatase 5